jgi:hypothetical protein
MSMAICGSGGGKGALALAMPAGAARRAGSAGRDGRAGLAFLSFRAGFAERCRRKKGLPRPMMASSCSTSQR